MSLSQPTQVGSKVGLVLLGIATVVSCIAGCVGGPKTNVSTRGGALSTAKGSPAIGVTAASYKPLDPFPDRDRPTAKYMPMLRGLKQSVVLVNYHDIIPKRTAQSLWFDCSIQEFRDQLGAMKKFGCHFISIQQLYDYLTKGAPLPSKPVAITFADGYEGFFKYGIPMLKRRHIPVAQFVHTGYVGSPIGRPKMTWQQLESLDKLPWVTIGSQTVTHPLDLRLLHGARLMKEMVDSREALEDHFHHPVRWLAYPNGKFDVEDEQAAKKAGYLMAFCEHQEPAQRSVNIFAVNRYVHTKWQEAIGFLRKGSG